MQYRDPDLIRRLDALEPEALGDVLRFLLPQGTGERAQGDFCANHPRPIRTLRAKVTNKAN